MSIKHDLDLIEKYRELAIVGSAKVTISSDEVTEVVVADLMAKYKACKKRGDEYAESFGKVLRFYLTEDEFGEMEAIDDPAAQRMAGR